MEEGEEEGYDPEEAEAHYMAMQQEMQMMQQHHEANMQANMQGEGEPVNDADNQEGEG